MGRCFEKFVTFCTCLVRRKEAAACGLWVPVKRLPLLPLLLNMALMPVLDPLQIQQQRVKHLQYEHHGAEAALRAEALTTTHRQVFVWRECAPLQ